MHRVRQILAAGLVAAAGLASAGPAAVAATIDSFSANLELVEVGEPESEWQADGILHVRGEPLTATVTGGLEGSFVVVRDYGFDLAHEGLVYNHATFVLETSTGTWSGTATQTPTRVKVVGKGADGSILRAIFTPIDEDTAALEGTILTP